MANSILQPKTLLELAESLALGGKNVFVAGGTDILIQMRSKPSEGLSIIDLSQMEDLKHCHSNESGLRIGALCTMTELNEGKLIQESARVLACAAGQVGSTQIRNRATIGGNVANAAQCADTIPALIALDADVELMNRDGAIRSMKVEDFVTGIGRTLITEQEVLTGFLIPSRSRYMIGGYSKVGSRKAVTIAKINGAGIFSIEDGRIRHARVAFGSLGQRGFYSELVSGELTGMTMNQLDQGEFLEFFIEQVEQAIPGRDSLPYKRSAVKAVASSLVEQIISQYQGS